MKKVTLTTENFDELLEAYTDWREASLEADENSDINIGAGRNLEDLADFTEMEFTLADACELEAYYERNNY